jgi:homoserine dehydrogenase
VRVHPAMIPSTHPLASVRDSYNAVFVEGDAVGQLMLLGKGAGGMPTASAVLGDLLDAAHNLTTGGAGRSVALRKVDIRPIDELRSSYYLTLQVLDRPGVLHSVSGVLGDHHVSIRLMEQEALPADSAAEDGLRGQPGEAAVSPSGAGGDAVAKLVFVTHPAYERDVQACLHDLRQLDAVESIGGLLRVIGS